MKIRIHGIGDGKNDVNLTATKNDFPDLFDEFYGEVTLSGTLTKIKNKHIFDGTATCMSKLVCDISGEVFDYEVNAKFSIVIIADTELYFIQCANPDKVEDEIAIHEDDVWYDISGDVKDYLNLNIPMRHVSPKFEGKTFEEIFPTASSSNKNGANL